MVELAAVFCDVADREVQVLAVVLKVGLESWLEIAGRQE
jgi:hypothetical protein